MALPAMPPEDNGRAESIQLHLRLRSTDVALLKQLASNRDQTLSATVRFLLYFYQRSVAVTRPRQPGEIS